MQSTEKVVIRKAPKFLSFFFLGAALGAITGLVLWAISLTNNPADSASLIGYITLVTTIFGAGLGVVLALVLDRVSRARSHTLEATKLVESAPKRRSKPAPKP